MSKFPHGGEVLGASPGHPLLAPVLRHEMALSRQQALLDQQAIQRIPGLVGYWSADPAYLFEDSGATTPATLNGVVGCWTSVGPVALQATTAVKPYLRQTPTSNVYWLDSNTSTSALTATLGNIGSACTVARAGAEGVTFTEGVTISSTYNIAPAYGFNGDVAIFNRALTTTEKALLTRYMQRGVPLLSGEMLENTSLNDLSGWTKIPAGSVDVTLANPGISILTSIAANVGIVTAIPINSILLFSGVFSNRSTQIQPSYIRAGSSASDVTGTDILAANVIKTDNLKLIFNNGSTGFIKMFTNAAVGVAFTLNSPSVRKIL